MATAEAELRPFVSALIKQIHAEADVFDFIRVPGSEPHYQLRVGGPGVVARWVTVPEGILRRAPYELAARRTLRTFLSLIILVQQAQRSLDVSRDLLADSG